MQYQRHQQPGCGGCLLLVILLSFIFGGAQGLVNLLGALFFSGLAGVLLLIGLFWGLMYFIQKQVSSYEESQTESHNKFVWLLVRILVRIAKIDGELTRQEVTTIRSFFQYNLHYSQTQMLWVKDLIKEALKSTESLETLLEEFRNSFSYEPRLILLELVYQILYTKEVVPENELQVARNIANYLNISVYDLRTIEAKYMYRQRHAGGTTSAYGTEEQHYATLGLEPGADMEAVKKAYRKLSMKYHPDKVRHLGEEFRSVAETKMKEINAAYDYFKKKGGG